MTPAQLKTFWGLVRRYQRDQGLDKEDAEYCARDHIEAVSGQRSTKDLSEIQANDVIRRLSQALDAGQFVDGKLDTARDPAALPTQNQLDMLERLRKAMKWERAQFQRFCLNHASCKRAWPQTRAQANALVEALKDMVTRQTKPDPKAIRAHKEELLTRQFELPLTPFERAFLRKVEKARMTALQKLKLEEIYAKRVGGGQCA